LVPILSVRLSQSIPSRIISLISFLILPSHLGFYLPSGLYPSFPTKTLYEFTISSCVLHALSIASALTW
jgi:hypothetical protein